MKETALFLAIAFSLSILLGHPRAAIAQDGMACSVEPAQVPRDPVKFDGTVVRSSTPEQAEASTEGVECQVGIKISPDYVALPRVVVRIDQARVPYETLAAVVDGHIPRPGDHVTAVSRYRDPRSHCNFIRWTIGSTPALS